MSLNQLLDLWMIRSALVLKGLLQSLNFNDFKVHRARHCCFACQIIVGLLFYLSRSLLATCRVDYDLWSNPTKPLIRVGYAVR